MAKLSKDKMGKRICRLSQLLWYSKEMGTAAWIQS